MPAPPEDDNNYLWEVSPGKWAIVINYDKVENKRKSKELPRQIMYLDDEIQGVTNGQKLNEIINRSLLYAPRNYPLIGIKTKEAMTVSGYDSALSEMFKPRHPRQNLLRKAYINYWHRAHVNGYELPESKLKAIANRMRHSLEVARGSYKKIDAIPNKYLESDVQYPTIAPPPKPIEIPKLPAEPLIPKVEPRKYFDLKAYGEEYRKAHADELTAKRKVRYTDEKHEILKKKQLWQLNHGIVKKPNAASIETYQLYQNDDGQWISREAYLKKESDKSLIMKRINNLYCDVCNYSTQKKTVMDTHMRTIKHKRNSEKKYKVYEGPEAIDKRMASQRLRKVLTDLCTDEIDKHYTDMNKLFEGHEIGEYENHVMRSYQTLGELEKNFKELPDENVLAKMKCKMLLDMVRDSHKNTVDGYCKTREHVMKK